MITYTINGVLDLRYVRHVRGREITIRCVFQIITKDLDVSAYTSTYLFSFDGVLSLIVMSQLHSISDGRCWEFICRVFESLLSRHENFLIVSLSRNA